jgi:hypothetical protein
MNRFWTHWLFTVVLVWLIGGFVVLRFGRSYLSSAEWVQTHLGVTGLARDRFLSCERVRRSDKS